MRIVQLRVQNIRAHTDTSQVISPDVTLITGDNGSGKTSLIEALMVALRGTSFRGTDTELLRNDASWWRIDVTTDDTKRTITFDPSRSSGKKRFLIDDKTSYRLTPQYKYPIVLFEPDDLRLLHGSPSRRREFIDRFIAQLIPTYGSLVRKYDRALKQRNVMLKNPNVTRDDLFVWDIAIGEYGAQIIEQRIRYIERFNAEIDSVYNTIAQSSDVVSMHYSHTVIGDIQQRIINELHARMERDRLLGYTSIGPHRDDIIFHFNTMPALSVASRGEVRSLVLALKFIEVDIISEVTGLQPIILLDDVFGELDGERQTHLATKFSGKQIIMTSASSAAMLDTAHIIHLE
ncbi:MAG: DNA replication and repair protein RecF [Candidatus Saccharimonadales bacterium]